jgi:aspartate beta-hydroxylase
MTQSPSQLDTLLRNAAAARQAGRPAEELRLLEAAAKLAPNDPRVLNARGMRALGDKDFAAARTLFSEAAARDPNEQALWMNVATACRGQGDDVGERQSLERALALNRLNFMAVLRMAELCERTGDSIKAALNWSHVVQMATGIEDRPPVVADALARGQAFLARHTAALSQSIEDELGPDLAALGSGARRFSACIDHILGRRQIYRNQCEGVHYPFLPADEFFDRAHFPWLARIEARTDAIRAEALALLSAGADAIRPYVRQDPGTPQNKWSALDHSLDWSACFLWEYGERNDPVCALCPETAAALATLPRNHIPGKAPSAFFSILKAGAHIPPHTGVTNTRAIVHLPLVVPEGCTFRVGGETRPWTVGEAFAFDDTIEHEAWNRSKEPRIVLIFDVWNPYLTDAEQDLLARFFALSDRQ